MPLAVSWEGRGVDTAFLSRSTPSTQAPGAGSWRTDVPPGPISVRGRGGQGAGLILGAFSARAAARAEAPPLSRLGHHT